MVGVHFVMQWFRDWVSAKKLFLRIEGSSNCMLMSFVPSSCGHFVSIYTGISNAFRTFQELHITPYAHTHAELTRKDISEGISYWATGNMKQPPQHDHKSLERALYRKQILIPLVVLMPKSVTIWCLWWTETHLQTLSPCLYKYSERWVNIFTLTVG